MNKLSKTPMKTVQASPQDESLRKEILNLIQRNLTTNTPEMVLAIASQVVGQALAFQNPITLGRDKAIELIQANIEKGNQDYVNEMLRREGKPPMFPVN